MAEPYAPITTPNKDYELCYECDGTRLCWSCRGKGVRRNGDGCITCAGQGLCIVCNGHGELPAGTRAGVDGRSRTGNRVAKRVGCFRELGFETAPSLDDLRGKRTSGNQKQVVAYLRAGETLIMSPGLFRDPYDRNLVAGSRSMVTDGVYAWPASLAHFVERYAVELPAEFEQHMTANNWTAPVEVDTKGLEIE